jgi:hypothetical protein
MRKLFFFTATIVFVTHLAAQKRFKKNMLYGEIGGNGLALSVNYERQLGIKPGLGLHIGLGLAGDKPGIPLGADYLFDLENQKSFIEAGVGITLIELEAWDDKNNIAFDHNPYIATFIPSIGYRHHTRYGLMWKVNYTPIFSSYRNIPLWVGASVGWRL